MAGGIIREGRRQGEGARRGRQEQENPADEQEKGKAERMRRAAEPLAAVCWHRLGRCPCLLGRRGYGVATQLWTSLPKIF